MKNFNRHREMAQDAHSRGSHAFTHTLIPTQIQPRCAKKHQLSYYRIWNRILFWRYLREGEQIGVTRRNPPTACQLICETKLKWDSLILHEILSFFTDINLQCLGGKRFKEKDQQILLKTELSIIWTAAFVPVSFVVVWDAEDGDGCETTLKWRWRFLAVDFGLPSR